MKEHTLLVEKYRSKTLNEYVGNENVKLTISKYLEQNDIQNLIFYGPAGTGKTTLAKLIVNNLNCDHLYINASDERGIETIRDKVSGFASVASFKPLKVVILDEADFLTIQAQASLRSVIETFSRSTRFILTCNFVERIIDPLQSRCQVLKIIPPSLKDVARHIAGILDQENITWDNQSLGTIVKQFYPDIRKILGTAQLSTIDNKIVLDKSILVSNNYIEQVINELKTSKNWKAIRQIVADSNINDYDELFKALYENASTYAEGNEGMITIIIEEYQYHSNFRIDKEINIMACIAKIIQIL
jgi:replication factor C small subunit